MAVTSEEIEHAHEAERLADHEVDQAFATGLRGAGTKPHVLTGQALTLSRRVAQLEDAVQQDQAKVRSLTAGATASASPADDLAIAKAQLGLDSDELADAQHDLARASGDDRDRIREELAAHEAEMSKAQTAGQGQTAVLSAQQYGTLAGRLKAWFNQRTRYQLIEQAMVQAQTDAAVLTHQHDSLEAQANAQPGQSTTQPDAAAGSRDTAAALARMKLGSQQRQLLGIYDDRIQTEQQLASTYGKWSAQVLLQHRILLHLIMQQLALIVVILLFLVAGDALVNRLMDRPGLDRRRAHTLRMVMKLGLQLLSVLLILLVLFGVPRQMPTILGLATAGITVVLQDFILAFFGWFVLMGSKGVRVGDSVEINGVAGDVAEVSLFRTTVHETGNWTDKGHPTGRRVTFLNNFAINGQYFNFSTAGQWLWDEISLNVPASDDAYVTIEKIYKAVLKETESDARLAEQEWKRMAKQLSLEQFSAKPAINLRPAASGIDILVRYVTRASDRFAMRNRLYQCILDVLHQPHTFQPQLQSSSGQHQDDAVPAAV
jgi:small-conductance mechanosensitive channel